jgi:hypothetical protein
MSALFLLTQEGPNTDLAWLLWLALGSFALMAITGWLTSRGENPEPEDSRRPASAPAKDTPTQKAAKQGPRKKSR